MQATAALGTVGRHERRTGRLGVGTHLRGLRRRTRRQQGVLASTRPRDAGNAEAQKTPNPAPAPGDAPDMLDVRDEAIRLAIQENSALAARHGHEAGKMNPAGEAQKLAGEDDQDDGGEDPA